MAGTASPLAPLARTFAHGVIGESQASTSARDEHFDRWSCLGAHAPTALPRLWPKRGTRNGTPGRVWAAARRWVLVPFL